MPLVFVHGVNVRKEDGYDEAIAARDALFREIALAKFCQNSEDIAIYNPYWGDMGAHPAWNYGSLPTGDEERFGPDEEPLIQALLAESQIELPTEERQINLALARGSLHDALDAIGALALQESARGKAEETRKQELKALTRTLDQLLDYADQHRGRAPDWLENTADDDRLFTMLQTVSSQWSPSETTEATPPSDGWESFGDGFWAKFKEAMSRIANFGNKVGGGLVAKVAREPLHRAVTNFLGDIIVYLNRRDIDDATAHGGIGGNILANLEAAHEDRTEADPLIVVCHSMGGNIVYDLLTHYASPDLTIDAWVTVGSQIAFFEELKAYKASNPQIPVNIEDDRVPKPPQVKHWLNIYDGNDILSFVAGRVFADVEDYKYSTGQGLFASHTTYFKRPSFHRRMGVRLRDLLGDRR